MVSCHQYIIKVAGNISKLNGINYQNVCRQGKSAKNRARRVREAVVALENGVDKVAVTPCGERSAHYEEIINIVIMINFVGELW
jgi:acetylglutamate kinase